MKIAVRIKAGCGRKTYIYGLVHAVLSMNPDLSDAEVQEIALKGNSEYCEPPLTAYMVACVVRRTLKKRRWHEDMVDKHGSCLRDGCQRCKRSEEKNESQIHSRGR